MNNNQPVRILTADPRQLADYGIDTLNVMQNLDDPDKITYDIYEFSSQHLPPFYCIKAGNTRTAANEIVNQYRSNNPRGELPEITTHENSALELIAKYMIKDRKIKPLDIPTMNELRSYITYYLKEYKRTHT